jgi:hypothetical protein
MFGTGHLLLLLLLPARSSDGNHMPARERKAMLSEPYAFQR